MSTITMGISEMFCDRPGKEKVSAILTPQELLELEQDLQDYVDFSPSRAAVYRGETSGYLTYTFGGTTLTFYDDSAEWASDWRSSRAGPGVIEEAVPARHSQHRLWSLTPCDRSLLTADAQQKMIAAIPRDECQTRGWLMVGPPGTSKTTYAAAAVIDWLTWRMLSGNYIRGRNHGHSVSETLLRLCYWRIKVPQWLRTQEAWETHDFADKAAEEPKDSIWRMIQAMDSSPHQQPILWLEELDKFSPTKNRLRNLYCLIDRVYEANGTIITTSNLRLPELQELVGDSIYRRLSGENDDPDEYLIWDLFSAPKKTKTAA